MSSPRFRFTTTSLEALPVDAKEYSVYDSVVRHLRCRVRPTGGKILEVEKRPSGKPRPVKVRVCALGELPLDARDKHGNPYGARARAQHIVHLLLQGTDPNAQRRAEARQQALDLAKEKAEQLTLQTA